MSTMLGTGAGDAVTRKVIRRRRQVAEAAQLRVHETDPDVVAWRVERTQRVVEAVLYAGIAFGLLFTIVNVQQFAAGDAPMSSLAWWSAWVLDPTVCAVLIGVLVAGKTLLRNGIRLRGWSKAAGVIAVAATYTMNTWESWTAGKPAQIVLHSVPPLMVFVAVEVLAELRGLFADAVSAAHARAAARASEQIHESSVNQSVNAAAGERSTDSAAADSSVEASRVPALRLEDVPRPPGPVNSAVREADKQRRSDVSSQGDVGAITNTARRRGLADFVADAQSAYTPGVRVTAEWVEQVAGCRRTSAFAAIRELRHVLPPSAFADGAPHVIWSANGSTPDGSRTGEQVTS